MRQFLTLTCCVGLASLVGAAQNNNQNNNQQYKKKGNAQQQVAPQTGGGGTGKKYYKTGQLSNPHSNTQNFQQSNTVGNYKKGNKANATGGGSLNTNAANTAFNKTKNVNINKNVTVNKNFKVQKFNVGNGPNAKYQAIKFNQGYHIAGANNWKGPKYVVFANYHPMWQSQWWWNQHYHNHVVFILGGWYYWNAGYWYPAWGYDPGSVYYFDGPIYASNPEMDPGQVVANVQSALQEQGYYQGDVDGVLGPQTRAALAEYQSAQGLEPTGAVDEPTLETLGMA